MSQLLRVQSFCVSTDGFGAGEGQSLEAPFGHAERRGGRVASLPADLASWAFATASWPNRTEPGGSRGLDDYFTRDFPRNIGAEIMGRNKFGPQRGPWRTSTGRGGGETPRPSTPPCSSSPTITDPASRWPTPRSTSSMRRPRRRCGTPRTPLRGRTCGSEAASPLFGSSSRLTSSTPSMSPSRRSRSAEGSDSDLPRGPARPVPPRVRAQPQRRDAPPLLAALTGRPTLGHARIAGRRSPMERDPADRRRAGSRRDRRLGSGRRLVGLGRCDAVRSGSPPRQVAIGRCSCSPATQSPTGLAPSWSPALTRTRRDLVSELDLRADRDGVPSDCVVNFDNVHTIQREAFRRRVTALSAERLGEAGRRLPDRDRLLTCLDHQLCVTANVPGGLCGDTELGRSDKRRGRWWARWGSEQRCQRMSRCMQRVMSS